MPIYEYVCPSCDIRFEKLVFNTSAQPECPQCESSEVKRVPSVFGFSSGGRAVTSSGSSGCASCTSHNCSNCK